MKWLSAVLILTVAAWAQMPLGGITGSGGGGGGTPAYVQGCATGNSGVANVSCSSLTVTSGNKIACGGAWNGPGGITFTSFTKNSGTATVGSFTQPDATATSGNFNLQQGWAAVTGSGTAVFRLTLSGTATGTVFLACHEISGLAASPVDAHLLHVQSCSSCTGTDSITTGNVTTTVANDYLFGITFDASNNSTAIAAGTNYTLRNVNGVHWASESQIFSTTGAVAATFTPTGGSGDTWINGILALHP